MSTFGVDFLDVSIRKFQVIRCPGVNKSVTNGAASNFHASSFSIETIFHFKIQGFVGAIIVMFMDVIFGQKTDTLVSKNSQTVSKG